MKAGPSPAGNDAQDPILVIQARTPEGCHSRSAATYCRGMTDEPGQHERAGEVRASDAEREAVVERLRVATVEGRLTLAS